MYSWKTTVLLTIYTFNIHKKKAFLTKAKRLFSFFISKCFDNEKKKQFIAKLVIKRLL